MKVQKLRKLFISGRKAGDGPKFAANFPQRRGHPNFEKKVSKLWPRPSLCLKGPGFKGYYGLYTGEPPTCNQHYALRTTLYHSGLRGPPELVWTHTRV